MDVKVYTREIDAGRGTQVLLFVDGRCIAQRLESSGGWYTGDGNPEYIGLTPRQIGMKARGFRRVRSENREMFEVDMHLSAD